MSVSSTVWFSFMLLGQPPVEAPPLAGRPPQFSHIVGSYRIETEADPTKIAVEEQLILKVRIVGQGPKEYQPQRKQLRIFPDDFAQQFYVEDLPEQDRVLSDENAWEFIYKLRSKSIDVKFIPGLKLVYYHPGRQKYATSIAEAIPLTVTPPQKVDIAPPKTIVAPPGFLELSSESGGSWRIPRVPPWWILLPGLVLPPLFCFVVSWWWPRRQSNADLARRNNALEELIKDLTNNPNLEDNISAIKNYLREKLHLRTLDPTPVEVTNRLRKLGASKDVVRDIQELLASCDRARFDLQGSLQMERVHKEVIRIVHRLEGEPCVGQFT